ATVVRCEPPTSGKSGDKAIITEDGKIWGWIGGGCTQPVVTAEALEANTESKPKLVRINPSAIRAGDRAVDYPMTCHSGGAMDIYVEPLLAKPHLLVLGRSPVAQTLARIATVIDYAVTLIVPEADSASVGDVKSIVRNDFSFAALNVTPKT